MIKNNIFRQYAILLVVNKLYLDYSNAINSSQGVEPEMFAEAWLNHFVEGKDKKFNDDICESFLNKLLEESKKNV